MATIGSFKKSENGDYAGAVKTLTLNVKARITPVEKANAAGADFPNPPTQQPPAQSPPRRSAPSPPVTSGGGAAPM